jgi:hypothetical protein
MSEQPARSHPNNPANQPFQLKDGQIRKSKKKQNTYKKERK